MSTTVAAEPPRNTTMKRSRSFARRGKPMNRYNSPTPPARSPIRRTLSTNQAPIRRSKTNEHAPVTCAPANAPVRRCLSNGTTTASRSLSPVPARMRLNKSKTLAQKYASPARPESYKEHFAFGDSLTDCTVTTRSASITARGEEDDLSLASSVLPTAMPTDGSSHSQRGGLLGATKSMDSFRGNCSFRGKSSKAVLMDDSSCGIDLLDDSVVDSEAHMMRLHLSVTHMSDILEEQACRYGLAEVLVLGTNNSLQDTTFARNIDLLQRQAETRCETFAGNVHFIKRKSKTGLKTVQEEAEKRGNICRRNVKFIREEGSETCVKFLKEKTAKPRESSTKHVQLLREEASEEPGWGLFARNLKFLKSEATTLLGF